MIGTIIGGLSVAMKALDLISNNVANAKTYGFKTSSMNFQDVYQQDGIPSRRVGEGAKLAASNLRHDVQGSLTLTGNVLDLAIKGAGFFLVNDAATGAVKYTRDGSFLLDANGFIVNGSGHFLRSIDGKAIQIPRQSQGNFLADLTVDGQGRVIATYEGQKPVTIASIALAVFPKPGALTPEGRGNFSATLQSGQAKIGAASSDGYGSVQSGALENSTSDIVKEMTRMIAAQQSFSANAKMLQTHNDMTARWVK
ncbi:MAG: flagellar hook basal-body protein [Rhodospirillaceae bacterium]